MVRSGEMLSSVPPNPSDRAEARIDAIETVPSQGDDVRAGSEALDLEPAGARRAHLEARRAAADQGVVLPVARAYTLVPVPPIR